ncbi:hypothetical protein Marpi_0163 [Marinitoga piezophila KA3]|uniref:Uncharacterized protein n=1 Tax=Marinitoga piezophila (strain DSM 14283 / JCM 11233 / KA3) TaxID=443254 RepID=H2J3H5_MARPK|nr:hypothetical protein [Marinitoga piezophila]AEX84619.1 hypothetical protein Marpi_0163 [Marinitoga piezophila KA3]
MYKTIAEILKNIWQHSDSKNLELIQTQTHLIAFYKFLYDLKTEKDYITQKHELIEKTENIEISLLNSENFFEQIKKQLSFIENAENIPDIPDESRTKVFRLLNNLDFSKNILRGTYNEIINTFLDTLNTLPERNLQRNIRNNENEDLHIFISIKLKELKKALAETITSNENVHITNPYLTGILPEKISILYNPETAEKKIIFEIYKYLIQANEIKSEKINTEIDFISLFNKKCEKEIKLNTKKILIFDSENCAKRFHENNSQYSKNIEKMIKINGKNELYIYLINPNKKTENIIIINTNQSGKTDKIEIKEKEVINHNFSFDIQNYQFTNEKIKEDIEKIKILLETEYSEKKQKEIGLKTLELLSELYKE